MIVRDNRITSLATANAMVAYRKWRPVFIIRGAQSSLAVYIFGECIYSRGWEI